MIARRRYESHNIEMRLWIALTLCAMASVAQAGDDANTLTVAVGQTVARDVGFAHGLQCDDVTILRPELRAKSPETNTFVVTGLKEGTTLCRVGTELGRPTVLYQVHVIAPTSSPARP